MTFVTVLSSAATLLEFCLLCLLLRGPLRKYPVFFAYILARFGQDLLLAYAYYHGGPETSFYRQYYWTTEMTVDLLLFFLMVTFTYEALRDNPLQQKAGKILAGIALLTLVSPFFLFRSPLFSNRWFNSTDQMLNFGGAIMNLVLWGALLANRKRDQQLLTISMGLGITATSAAVVWGARLWVNSRNRWPFDAFSILMYCGSLLLWCWVFRPQKKSTAASLPGAAATLS